MTPLRFFRVMMLSAAVSWFAVGCSSDESPDAGEVTTVVDSPAGTSVSIPAGVTAETATTLDPATDIQQQRINLLPEVVATLHPGFEFVSFLGVEDSTVFIVEARHTLTPALMVRVWYAANSNDFERSRAADIGGVHWVTPDQIDELTQLAELVTGGLQAQLINSIVTDTGFATDRAGRYVVILAINSNVEVVARVTEADGETLTDYVYRLDMTASPAVFRLVA